MLVIQRPTVEALGEDDGNRQRFAVGPLEPGFGHTIGNSLRRTLLSSIPGAAITQVRFDDALHEFDTIAGVTEDVTDIILNLKDLVLTSTADEPVTLRLDVRGPADVTAGDIQSTSRRRDPQHRTCTSPRSTARAAWPSTSPSSGAVATCPADRETQTTTRSASSRSTHLLAGAPGDLPRSSRPASSSRPNYDRLVLDIETDGSISPREALASAGATLRSLVDLVANMSDEPQGLELGEVAGATRRLARPRPAHRGPRPVRASPQLPQAGPGQHDRRAARRRPRTTCWPSPTSARSPSTRSSQKLDERGLSLRGRD